MEIEKTKSWVLPLTYHTFFLFFSIFINQLKKGVICKMAKYEIKIHENKFIPMFYPYLNNNEKNVNVFLGSRNSGKSVFIAQKLLYLAMNDPDSVTLVVRELKNSLKGSCFKSFVDILKEWGLYKHCSITTTDMVINLPNGAIIYFVGCDCVDGIKSMTKINRIFLEECDAIDYNSYETISGSIRGESKFPPLEFFSFNPPNGDFWLLDLYMKGIDLQELYNKKVIDTEVARIHHNTWRDNSFCDQNRLKTKYDYLKTRDYFRWLRDSEGQISNAEQSGDNLYNYDLIFNAINTNIEPDNEDSLIFSCDVARFGEDSTCISYRKGNKVYPQIKLHNKRGHEIADYLLKKIEQVSQNLNYKGRILVNIDSTGVGASVCDSLSKIKRSNLTKYKNLRVNEVNFANKAKEADLYTDIISEAAFILQQLMLDNLVTIPDDKKLIEELANRKRIIDNKNRDGLEQKVLFKKRLGRSPDNLDSLLLLFVQTIKHKLVVI